MSPATVSQALSSGATLALTMVDQNLLIGGLLRLGNQIRAVGAGFGLNRLLKNKGAFLFAS